MTVPTTPFDPALIEAAFHGDENARIARGHAGEALIDFSVNINPLGSTQSVVDAARGASLHSYPDPHAREASEAIAASIGVSPREILLGHGATEILWLAIAHLAPRHGELAIFAPTFTEPLTAANALDRPTRLVAWWPFDTQNGLREAPSVPWVRDALRGVPLAYLCTPNNPTGHRVCPDRVRAYAEATPDTLWIVDEAFVALSTHPQDVRAPYPSNVLRLRSLTKDHGVPGLRLAYAVAEEGVIARLSERRAPWSTSSMTQAAAIATTHADDHIASTRKKLLRLRSHLDATLRDCGLSPFPSSTIFSLVPLPQATLRCRALASDYGILLRDARSFGLENHVRIVARPEPEQQRLAEALHEILGREFMHASG